MERITFDSSRPLDVAALGRVNLDFNPTELFRPWKECQTFRKYVGGSPANITVGLSRLGKKAGLIGCVSDDQMGVFCREYLERQGVDTRCLATARGGEHLGVAFTEIESPTKCKLTMYRDNVADLQLTPRDVQADYIASAKLLLISGTALSASPSREAALTAIELARRANTPILFDIDYRPWIWRSDDEISVYYTLAAREADIIMGSREEYDRMDALLCPGLTDEQTARRWFGERAGLVIIKHGKDGSAAYAVDGERFLVRPFPIQPIKSTGGGDVYGSAFLYGMLEGWPLAQCLEFGSASASMVIASPSCSEDMPTAQAIREFIDKEKAQYGEMIFPLKEGSVRG